MEIPKHTENVVNYTEDKTTDTVGFHNGPESDKTDDSRLDASTSETQIKMTFWVVYAALTTAMVGFGQCGYNVTVLAAPTKTIQEFYNQSHTGKYGQISDTTMDWLWATTVALFAVGGAFGALAAPPICDILGRKYGLLLVNVFSISGALMFGGSKFANSFELVVMGRIVIGFYCGITMAAVPLFISEISPKKYRGALGCAPKFLLSIGILMSQGLGIFVLNTDDTWHYLLAVTGLFSVIHLIMFPPCPDSPRWLLITAKKPTAAKKALQTYYGVDDVTWAMEEILHEHKEEMKEERVTLKSLFSNKLYRQPLLISFTVMSSVQLCGLPALYQYAIYVFGMIWPNDTKTINYAILGTGLAEAVSSFTNIFIIDRVGRRPLLLYTCACMAVLNGIITLSLNLSNPNHADGWTYVSLICIYCSIVAFSLGPGNVSYILTPELWTQGPRPLAVGLAVQVQWWSNFLVTLIFPFLQTAMDAYMFLLFMAIMVYYTVFVYFLVPETKMKSFEEIVAQFRLRGKYTEKDNHSVTDDNTEMGDVGQN